MGEWGKTGILEYWNDGMVEGGKGRASHGSVAWQWMTSPCFVEMPGGGGCLDRVASDADRTSSRSPSLRERAETKARVRSAWGAFAPKSTSETSRSGRRAADPMPSRRVGQASGRAVSCPRSESDRGRPALRLPETCRRRAWDRRAPWSSWVQRARSRCGGSSHRAI